MKESRRNSRLKVRRSVFGVVLENIGEIDLVVAGRAGTGAPVVETPHAAVGQYSPASAAVGGVFGRTQVAQNLAVRSPSADYVVLVAGVEGKSKSLALFDRRAHRA